MKRVLVQVHIIKLLDVGLVELLWGKFFLTIIIPSIYTYVAIGLNIRYVWGLSSDEQMNVFGQVYYSLS